MKKAVVIALLVTIVLMSFNQDKGLPFPTPKGWPKPVYNFKKQPLSVDKVQLGRMLFYDPILSRDSTVSCASCHAQATAFTHVDHDLSHGINDRIGTRNSLALVNLAWSKQFMWDGSISHLDRQAEAPITNPLEMDERMENVVRKLQRGRQYPRAFYAAFGDSVITAGNVSQALSQFMLTLVSANSKYDKVKRGEDSFTHSEQRGYRLYQQHCSSCHTEPLFTNQGFENNGLMVDTTLNDAGLAITTHKTGDSLKFKVPTLRNIRYTFPYMHDGRFKDLNQVLNYYIRGIQRTPGLSPKLQKGIFLTGADKADLFSFLSALTDTSFLRDPRLGFPKEIFFDRQRIARH